MLAFGVHGVSSGQLSVLSYRAFQFCVSIFIIKLFQLFFIYISLLKILILFVVLFQIDRSLNFTRILFLSKREPSTFTVVAILDLLESNRSSDIMSTLPFIFSRRSQVFLRLRNLRLFQFFLFQLLKIDILSRLFNVLFRNLFRETVAVTFEP